MKYGNTTVVMSMIMAALPFKTIMSSPRTCEYCKAHSYSLTAVWLQGPKLDPDLNC